MTIAGLGCRRGCTAAELRELLEKTLRQLALPLGALDGLATSEHKRGEAGLVQLAAELDLPLTFFSAERLAAHDSQLSEHSAPVRELIGAPSVAEASALAGAAQRSGRSATLLCSKQRSAAATLAIARA
ncbi:MULTISPECIES: cobalamin biosynthesis protein [unclassified Pseudomonas]|uniref:cobalamin biosynthesis protein n=1 Tax=unclassified Pseudomonas TaxID=196821 RepID=UPI00244795D0|nr:MULTISPECIES: cobalamin biosynthesis protein [unclassified Pseudomonas]MDG9931084.1 cobalamin biosynthesis protein [Pseudomonas sp. GD04042]MDH0485551.1 cobalamin biosynthesis protein [Pseudomonas sp. GD04015]MDH0606876.1 cobalamin biosynthesis protein [Pseudomonas sp. GD03869]